MALAKELRLCPKNSEELVGGFKGKYRIRSVVRKDCPDGGGENEGNWEAREGGAATIGSQRDIGAVLVLSLPDSVIWGELTSWCCSSTSVKWG